MSQSADSAPHTRLRKWVVRARRKFNLPHTTQDSSHDYWRGYEACLEDVEGLASQWEAHIDSSGPA